MTSKPKVRESVAGDGRRVEKRVTRTTLDDGSIQEVHEELQEVVPMETTKRVTRTFARIPVEEKIEAFQDGSVVETSVKTLSGDGLELHTPSSGFDADFGSSVADCGCPSEAAVVEDDCCQHHGRSFMGKAVAKYGSKKHCHHRSMDEAAMPAEKAGKMEQAMTSMLWIVFAVITGLVVFALI